MECPYCDVPLIMQSAITEEEYALLGGLPYIIAYPLKRTLDEGHYPTKINLLKDTFLNYLKYMGLVSASEFFNSELKNKNMVALFQEALSQPSFGTWNKYIRETLIFLKDANHQFFCPELLAYYDEVEAGPKRKLYKVSDEYINFQGETQFTKPESTAINMLIYFRNRFLGHAQTPNEVQAKVIWEEYSPIFLSLLQKMRFVSSYPMYKNEHGLTYKLQSAEILEVEHANPTVSKVWIEKGDAKLDTVPFFIVPGELAISKEDKEQLLTYESYTGKTVKFFSPEGTEKQTSGKILERLNLLLREKQNEATYNPDHFTKDVLDTQIKEQNKLLLDILVSERKVLPGVYVHRNEIESKLREWIGARMSIFFIAAEAGSGKTNLLVEMQRQYTERGLQSLLVRAGRMDKPSLVKQVAYMLNLDEQFQLSEYRNLWGTQESPTFILIDGLNESLNSEAIWEEILDLVKLFAPGSLKIVVTSRANTSSDLKRFELSKEDEQLLYRDSSIGDTDLPSSAFWLTALNMLEMKEAWNFYSQKDKSQFKPLFKFDEIASIDRGIYDQISNPLILRIFLEVYNGKTLVSKGNKYVNIWQDWLATFTNEERNFMNLLAWQVWLKGKNELLLDDLFQEAELKEHLIADAINAPYQRLKNLGWISRFTKDLDIVLGFTVEGLLLYLIGKQLSSIEVVSVDFITDVVRDNNSIKTAAIEALMCEQTASGDLRLVSEIIDRQDELLKLCTKPLLIYLKTQGAKALVESLLANPTQGDWRALTALDEILEDLALEPLRKSLGEESIPFVRFEQIGEIRYGLVALKLLDDALVREKLDLINHPAIEATNEPNLITSLGWIYAKFAQYDKALELFKKCLTIELKILGAEHTDVATTYYYIGDLWQKKGEYDKALEFYEKCLAIELKTLGAEHPYVAQCYTDLGVVWSDMGEYDKALELYEKGLAIRLMAFGAEHPDVATSFNNLGSAWSSKGEYDKALDLYEKCLAIRLKTLGAEHPYVATSFNNLGVVWSIKGEYDKALEFYEKGLAIELKTLGAEHPNVATSFNNLGVVWSIKGEYDKALELYEKGLAIRLKTLEAEHPDVATSYNNLGSAWSDKGEYDKALELSEKGLAIRLKTIGAEHPDVATSYNNLGVAWSGKGEYDKALEFYEKGLAIRLKTLGAEHPDVATNYNYLGVAWSDKGEYDKALELYEKGLAIRLMAFGAEHPDVATSYNNLGSAWCSKGEYDKALELSEKGLAIRLKTIGAEHPDVATNYNHLGNAWYSKGEYDKALEFYEKGLARRLKILGAEHPDVATSYNNLGVAWSGKGEYDKALEFYEKCLAIELKTLGAEHPYVAQSYTDLGSAWSSKGEYDKALELYEKCLAIRLKTLGAEHPDVATSYKNLGVVWSIKGEYDKALEFYEKCLAIELKTLGAEHPNVAFNYNYLGVTWFNKGEYHEAIKSFVAGYKTQKKGGFLFQIAQCYEALSENLAALDYYIQSAEIRANDPEVGIGDERTIKSIENTIRLANLIDKEKELPLWIKNFEVQK
jgi:tetratricopeptide (TPR) repeat protein